jgi:ferric-dicitrate binding protein FerR (iron transport regulator)
MEFQNNIDILIIRLLSGEANTDEKRQIAGWLEESAENKRLYADLKEIWLTSGIQNNADHYQLEEAILKFRNHIHEIPNSTNSQFNFRHFLKYAAIFAILLAIPFSYFAGKQNARPDQTTTTITCAFGDKSNIILPDSSMVWLNSGSKLTFDSDFKNKGRKVELEGEAFFMVTKDKDHTFQVKTHDIGIEVLGTSFNLKAYPEEKLVSATLVEGSMQVESKYQKTRMIPDQKLTYDKEKRKMVLTDQANVEAETEWKDGRLVFRNESLAELAPKLQRWFDVDIVFADERVKQRKFTGALFRESILEVISYFDLSKLVKCHIQGNKIIIQSEN